MSFTNGFTQALASRTNLLKIVILAISCLLSQILAEPVLTYKRLSPQISQLVTSDALVWESFTNDPKQLEFAVPGAQYVTEDENYTIFVCRALFDGTFASGHTEKRKQKNMCVVAMLMEVRIFQQFEILVNRGHLGKLTWKAWNKFSGGTPNGTVSVTGKQVNDAYVARHRAKITGNHPHHNPNEHHGMGADYNLGRFNPVDRLGKIIVVEEGIEREYEEGELLVETEPVRYEIREIRVDKIKGSTRINTTDLGSSILSNPLERFGGGVSNLIETVISYEYDKIQHYGSAEGVARGLPTKVYKSGVVISEILWGLRKLEKIIETKTVSTNLKPGTALNVTLRGNYTTFEAPYTATLVTYYADNENSVSRPISGFLQEASMYDLKLEFSGVYWLNNGSLIPTTTTTTTTTTSTEPTSTSTKGPAPVFSPPVVISSGDSSSSSSSSSSSYSGSEGGLISHPKPEMDDMMNSNDIAADESRESTPLRNVDRKASTSASKSGCQKTTVVSSLLGIVLAAFTLVQY